MGVHCIWEEIWYAIFINDSVIDIFDILSVSPTIQKQQERTTNLALYVQNVLMGK